MPLTTPTYKQAFLGQGSLASKRSSWLNSSRNGPPTRGEEWLVRPFVLTRWEIVQPVPSKAVLQPAKAAAMRTAPRTETHPPSPIPPFFKLKTYLQNELHQLITCGQRQMKTSSVVKGLTKQREEIGLSTLSRLPLHYLIQSKFSSLCIVHIYTAKDMTFSRLINIHGCTIAMLFTD